MVLRPRRAAAETASVPGLLDELLRVAGYPVAGSVVPAELATALRLLARADHGVRARIENLAVEAPDTYAPLLATLDTRPEVQPVRQNHDVMRNSYQPAADGGLR